jgi:hypothetical protein
MADVKSLDVYNQFVGRVVGYTRSGISWGTNIYPANSLVSWFGGTTSGDLGVPSLAQLQVPSDELTAKTLRDVFMSYVNVYSRIRRTQIYITRSKSGYSNNTATVIYNAIAIAHLPAGDYVPLASPAAGGLVNGLPVDQSQTYDYIERVRNLYAQSARVNTLRTFSRQVCHTQCHSNCHNSRGRR